MPTAAEEGYETLVICPYDKSHEIRKGRMQFHLDKCRKNFPQKSKEMVQCPFNSVHLIPRHEESYHTQEECVNRAAFINHTHQIGDISCPVKDLVPVNGATSNVDADENWDDFEAPVSVLNVIRKNAEEKPILRLMQCQSKSKKKMFRQEERKRYSEVASNNGQPAATDVPSSFSEEAPLRRPVAVPSIPVRRQEPQMAAATLNSCMKSLDLKEKPSEAASVPTMSTLPQPISPSIASPSSGSQKKPPSYISYAPTSCPGSYKPHTHRYASESQPKEFKYESASSSSMSSFPSLGSRPATATFFSAPNTGDGFCQIPMPGLGRGSRRKNQN